MRVAIEMIDHLTKIGVSRDDAITAVEVTPTIECAEVWVLLMLSLQQEREQRGGPAIGGGMPEPPGARNLMRAPTGAPTGALSPAPWKSGGRGVPVPGDVRSKIVGAVRAGATKAAIAREYNLSQTAIHRICARERRGAS